MLKVMLVGGDGRQFAQLKSVLGDHGETVAHWVMSKHCYAPKNEPKLILCYTKHCSHGMTEQARKLATKLRVPIVSNVSMNVLLTHIKDSLPKAALVKPKPKELKRAIWERWNRKAPNVSAEADRISSSLEDEYGWQTTSSNVRRIISQNQRGWVNGAQPGQVAESQRSTPTIDDELVAPQGPEVPRGPSTQELRCLVALSMKAILDELQKMQVAIDQMPSEEDSQEWEERAAEYKSRAETAETRLAMIKDTLKA